MTGKIAYFGKNGKVGFEEHELPEVEPGAMLVRVLSSNICGSDVKNWKTGASLGVGGDKTCQGHEFVGRIERLGRQVEAHGGGRARIIAGRARRRPHECHECHQQTSGQGQGVACCGAAVSSCHFPGKSTRACL